MDSRYRPELDGIRGVAIFVVVLAHALPAVLQNGSLGVDIFFVLSGYLITGILRDELSATGSLDWPRFYARRALRLMPPLWTMLLVFLPLIVFGHHTEDLAKSWSVTAVYLMNWNRALGWWPEYGFGHTWSLAAEEQFYLLWPVLFLLVARRSPAKWLAVAIVSVITWRTYLNLSGAGFARTYNGFDTHLDPLLIGCLLALVSVPSLLRLVCQKLWPFTAAAIVAMTLVPFTGSVIQSIGVTLNAALGVLLVIGSGSGQLKALLSTTSLVFTGRISYSLYLWHFPLIVFAASRYPSLSPFIPVVGAYLIASVSYFTVEAYFRRVKRGEGWKPWLPATV